MINVHNLENVILQKMNALSSTEDLLVYASAINTLKQGTVSVVETISQLPASSSVADGMLVFVDNELTLYYNKQSLNQWVTVAQTSVTSVWAWGYNAQGRLGDNSVTSRLSPVSVAGGFTDWCQVSIGDRGLHTAAIRTNGTLWTWGSNSCGQLGHNTGTTCSRSSPVSVVGGFADWCQVSGGARHTAAIRTNGTLWTWGNNGSGQLGDNNPALTSRSSPVSVVGGFADWCQVSAGYSHTAAIRTNGTLWTWGNNGSGKLGDNTTTDRSSPVSVVGGFADWCQVSARGHSTAAIRTDGTLWTWGMNNYGQLGHNTATTCSRSSPVNVAGGFTDWCQVSAGYRQMAAVRTNGTIWAWGENIGGQLGDNTQTSRNSPVIVIGGFTDWCQVSTGYRHTAAVRTNGTLWTWGLNGGGRLGDNTITARSSPVSVVGGFTNWCQVSAGDGHTAGLRATTF